MVEFVVNIALLLAVLIGAAAVTLSCIRRRRISRERALEERTVLLQALLSEHAAPTAPAGPLTDAIDVPGASLTRDELLLELLGQLDQRPSRRGALTGLIASPMSAWRAGERAARGLTKPER